MLIVITQAYIHLGRTGVDGNNLHTNQELQNKNRKFKCFQMKKKNANLYDQEHSEECG